MTQAKSKTIYLNMRTSYGVETVDSFSADEMEPKQTPKEFRQYVNKMISEYHLAGQPVYKSSRCAKEWANN